MSKFNDKKINKLAEEISFRLLATRKHADFNWLVKKLYLLVDYDYTNLLVDYDYTKVANEENYFKKYSEKEWKRELDLNVEMAKRLIAHQAMGNADAVWEDLVADLIAMQSFSNIPGNIDFFVDWVKSQETNELPNQSSGSFFTGLTDVDGLLSAMNFEEYDKEIGEDLYTDEEYTKAQKYHTDKINNEIPDWTKY